MPTGYTAEICEKDIDFNRFVMTCAKAFVFHDVSDLNAPIAENKISQYYVDSLKESESELEEVQAWTEKRAKIEAQQSYELALESHNRFVKQAKIINDRITAMLAKVKAWNPPTGKHTDLKRFMIEQLEDALKHEGTYTYSGPTKQSGKEFKETKIERIKHSIKYAREQIERDSISMEESNYWIQKLKDSLKT